MDSSLPNEIDRRQRIRFDGDAIQASLNRQPVRVLDISLTGLGFETTERLNLQGSLEFQLETVVGDISVSGRVVWCKANGIIDTDEREVMPVYRAGLRFGPLGERDGKRLHELLALESERQHASRAAAQEEITSEFSREEIETARPHAEASQGSSPQGEPLSREEVSEAVREAMGA